jgi:hypothetical protein
MLAAAMSVRMNNSNVRRLNGTWRWRVFFQSEMCTNPVVVVGVPLDHPSWVLLSQNNRMVQALSSDGTVDTLDVRVLPRG